MSKSYEFQGKNVDNALEIASGELNIPAEKIKHKVLAYGSSGIFGLVGVKKAKIKVFIESEQGPKTLKKAALSGDTVPTRVNEPAAEPEAEKNEAPSAEPPERLPFDANLVASAADVLKEMVAGITAGAAIDVSQRSEKLIFSITGGESGVLIGKRGQTLEAIQYLLEKIVNKKSAERIRVLVDVEGYLEKRTNNLQQMASRLAEKAKRIKKPVTLGQMNAHDRRIVHIHLKDEQGVRTQSIGDGYYRKLMIFPKKQESSKPR